VLETPNFAHLQSFTCGKLLSKKSTDIFQNGRQIQNGGSKGCFYNFLNLKCFLFLLNYWR